MRHASVWTRPPVGARQVLAAEDARPGDEQARARVVQLAHVLGPDAAVDLDVDLVAAASSRSVRTRSSASGMNSWPE